MARQVLTVVLFVAVGVFIGRFVFSSRTAHEPIVAQPEAPERRASSGLGAVEERPSRDRFRALAGGSEPSRGAKQVEREADPLPERRAQLRREEAQREEPRRERVEVQRPAVDRPGRGSSDPGVSNGGRGTAETATGSQTNADESKDPIERALINGGLDLETATDVKRRYDDLDMEEKYLYRDAAEEGWLDTPRFDEELEEIEVERLAIRNEIGDAAYDHFLFAKGQPNRVYVMDVFHASPAEQAGLRMSDVIVHYGGVRIFSPEDLLAETSGGNPGEIVQLDVRRQNERIALEVPAGPLGLRVGKTQEPPER